MAAKTPDLTYVDFETKGIEKRPAYPPEPVGVSILEPGSEPVYHSWGHPTNNNTTKAKGRAALAKVWLDPRRVLCFHHAKFDIDVGETYLDLALPEPERMEDTGILGFLALPRAYSHRLKDLARALLNIPADERDELKRWVLTNCKEQLGRKTKGWEAYMWMAPGDLVGRYGRADVVMTKKLRAHFEQTARDMSVAYLRERCLVRVILQMERLGVPVDVPALRRDVPTYRALMEKIDVWVRKRLKASPDLNVDADQDLADALARAGKVADDGWVLTPKGQRSVAADALEDMLTDKQLLSALTYRGTLATCLGTFMEPYLISGEKHEGIAYVEWNQFKEKGLGTKSGRLSSSPNFQNIPTELDKILLIIDTIIAAFKRLKTIDGKLPLPMVRRYIAAHRGEIIFGRDYNSQEYRFFAHYENGALCDEYIADPWMDIHQKVTDMVNAATGRGLSRRLGKTLNFGVLYGQGIAKLARSLGISYDEAKALLMLYFKLVPGIKKLREMMDDRERNDEPIWTIGGRRYFCEPAFWSKAEGRLKRYAYRLVNLLMQAGSADQTKAAMIEYYTQHRKHGRLIMQVHDELVGVCPIGREREELARLKLAMEVNPISQIVNVPMLSEGYYGPNFFDTKSLPRGE